MHHTFTSLLMFPLSSPADRWKRARSMGIDAAMIVIAPSAMLYISRLTVVTSK